MSRDTTVSRLTQFGKLRRDRGRTGAGPGSMGLVLIVMAGLPGAGKSAVATDLAKALGCPVLSVDPVEAAMLRAGIAAGEPTGLAAYVVVEALATDHLRLGQHVVIDAVNAAAEARQQWRDLAQREEVALRWIEVVCSDRAEHQRRLESRGERIPGFREPAWDSVMERRDDFVGWDEPRLVLDSLLPQQINLITAVAHLSGQTG